MSFHSIQGEEQPLADLLIREPLRDEVEDFQLALAEWLEQGLDGTALTFVYMQIAPGAKKNLGRPKVRPPEVRERFMKFIGRAGVPA